MRILIVTPLQPQATGNQVTAQRHQAGLEELGHTARLVMTGTENPALLRAALADFRPDLVHLLHAYRSGRPFLACAGKPPSPFVLTLTGTDIHHGIDTPAEAPVIGEVLARAAAIITQNPLTAEGLRHRRPEWTERVRYLPPGIVLGTTPYPLRRRHGIPAGDVLFLHPAGIRPIKGNLELLRLFDRLAGERSGFGLAFCGPVLDRQYGERFFAAVAERPWARYLETIPVTAMAAALREADIVLNHSLSEGMPNVLLEAAAVGRPLLVRDNQGSAAVLAAGGSGLLYRDEAEFTRHALALLDDPALRRRLSQPRPDLFRPEAEARALEAIYREVLAGQRPFCS